jgi:Lon protease-like protein
LCKPARCWTIETMLLPLEIFKLRLLLMQDICYHCKYSRFIGTCRGRS